MDTPMVEIAPALESFYYQKQAILAAAMQPGATASTLARELIRQVTTVGSSPDPRGARLMASPSAPCEPGPLALRELGPQSALRELGPLAPRELGHNQRHVRLAHQLCVSSAALSLV